MKPTKLFLVVALFSTTLIAGYPAHQAKNDRAEVALQAAIKKEIVDGDLKAAIALYKQVIEKNGGSRSVAAKALLRLGGCYEKLGQEDSRKTYEQLLADYPEQQQEVAAARQRLAVLKSMTAKTLFEAAFNDDIEQVKLLISQGAEVNAKDSQGRTALHLAAGNVRKEVAELLIENGADVNAKWNSRTPLHVAAGGGHFGRFEGPIEIVELLIENGADINAKNEIGVPPLHMATRNGRKDIVELLIVKGADVNATDNRGNTALSIAVRYGHTEIIELLKEHGARIK